MFVCSLLQTPVPCVRPQVLLPEGSRGQTSDRSPELCPWHATATGERLSGISRCKLSNINVCYCCLYMNVSLSLTAAGLYSYGCAWHAAGGSVCEYLNLSQNNWIWVELPQIRVHKVKDQMIYEGVKAFGLSSSLCSSVSSTCRRVVGCSPMPTALRSIQWTRFVFQTSTWLEPERLGLQVNLDFHYKYIYKLFIKFEREVVNSLAYKIINITRY